MRTAAKNAEKSFWARNLILDTDSYKASHFLQYPPHTSALFSYVESRGGKYDHTVFFGLQYILAEYLSQPVTLADVEEAEAFFLAHGEPFPAEGWRLIVTELGGKIPLRIRAVPEGSVVPTHNVLMTVESTDPRVPWVVSWFETMLLRVWYPITVATQSWHIRQLILAYLERTAEAPEAEIDFKLHDFGSRGVSSRESASIGAAAHLVNFLGTDTVVGVGLANHYYGAEMAGFSIPAAEHSSITSWGREREVEAYRNMLRQFAKPGALVAVVSDSYDVFHAVEHLWGGTLRQEVIDSGATLVIRPDSGDPATVVLKCLQLLDAQFGSTLNAKGFKVLQHVRVLQGDGINQESIREILELATANGYSASNIAFGMGGALLQQVNRDTQKFAFKCSQAVVEGRGMEVFKDPVTDPGKRSKRGRLDLVGEPGAYRTITLPDGEDASEATSAMRTVFENGELTLVDSLAEIRARARATRLEMPLAVH